MGLNMAKKTNTKAAVEPDQREIPGAWVSASLIPGEPSTSWTTNNTGRDFELVSRGITGTAWRAASINATVVSGQCLRLYRNTGMGGKSRGRKVADPALLRHLQNRGPVRSVIGKAALYAGRAGDQVEEVLDHPVLDLLQNPDPLYTGPLWLWMVAWFKEICGRAYLYVGERSSQGPVSAYILPSEYAWPILDDKNLIRGYYYGRNSSDPMRIAAEDVIYLRQNGSPVHPAGGMSWLLSVVAESDMEAAALKAEVQRWLNGGMPGMVFKAAPTTTDAQMKQISAHLNQQTRGVGKAGSVLLLRDTELQEYGTKPHEMQYVEGITTTEKRIYDAAGIPEPIYRLNSANLASATVANAQYMRFTIAPRLAVLAAEFTELLLPQFGVEPGEMWFAFDNPVQEDQIQLAAELRAAEAQGLVTPNEYRKVMDLEALPDAANVLRYRQTEAPAPMGGGIFGGLPAPAKAEEMPSQDVGEASVDVSPETEAEPEAPTMDASVDLEEPAAGSVDVEPEELTMDAKAVVAAKAPSYEPTAAMAEEAQRGLDWRAEYGRGGTAVGVARARDIVNRRNLSLDTVYRMASYFARHEVDQQGQGWSEGEEGYPSAGRIAWALWGGDAGRTWAEEIINEVEAAEEKALAETVGEAGKAEACTPPGTEACRPKEAGGDVQGAAGGEPGAGSKSAAHAADANAADACSCGSHVSHAGLPAQLRRKAALTVWDEEAGTPRVAAGAYRQFVRELSAWYISAVPAMVDDFGMVAAPSNEAMADLTAISERFIQASLASGAMSGLEQLGKTDGSFDVANEPAMAFIRNQGLALATSVPDTLKPSLQAAIERELAAGTSVGNMRDAIRKVAPELTEYQAVRIARTETLRAYCEGQRQAWIQEGVQSKGWINSGGPCPICDQITTKYPNDIPIDEYFTVDAGSWQAPPAHPNCRCDLVPGLDYDE
jgi:HK97 family phage portal protein